MKHRILTTLDTADESYTVERLAHVIAPFTEATLEVATDVWAVELDEATPGAVLRDVVETLDKAGFLN